MNSGNHETQTKIKYIPIMCRLSRCTINLAQKSKLPFTESFMQFLVFVK